MVYKVLVMKPFDFYGGKDSSDSKNAKHEVKRIDNLLPIVFQSDCHQRYERGRAVMGEQHCCRTIRVERNVNGCPGYRLVPGKGYIVKIINDETGRPNMSDKPMTVVSNTEGKIDLRGFPIEAMSPFGWQEVDYSVYGLTILLKNDAIYKCVLHMFDRNVDIDYMKISLSQNNEKPKTVAEELSKQSCNAFNNRNKELAQQYGLKVLNSIIESPKQILSISDYQSVALSLGRLMEGNYLPDMDSVLRGVGITYFFLCKAISKKDNKDPYLYVYRYSLTWEYNNAFCKIFSHSDGKTGEFNKYNVFDQCELMEYDHHLAGMQMADMFTEPRIAKLDAALGNIFRKTFMQYRNSNPEEIKRLGNSYHMQIYNYIKGKVENFDFNF